MLDLIHWTILSCSTDTAKTEQREGRWRALFMELCEDRDEVGKRRSHSEISMF